MTKRNLQFHLHNDLNVLSEYPSCFTHGAEIYAMQEDRVVFIGLIEACKGWIKANEGKYLETTYKKLRLQ